MEAVAAEGCGVRCPKHFSCGVGKTIIGGFNPVGRARLLDDRAMQKSHAAVMVHTARSLRRPISVLVGSMDEDPTRREG